MALGKVRNGPPMPDLRMVREVRSMPKPDGWVPPPPPPPRKGEGSTDSTRQGVSGHNLWIPPFEADGPAGRPARWPRPGMTTLFEGFGLGLE